ncbi:hypothetical protein CesoFtcFv8_015500 [Champsocephalus esox]|uniref:Uncharacterized protein n=1 Tax=Champsocephalus esox TaxID=159716 RepID=A0AAN8BQ88_9TELE|nr:hypothetical protein CesoFtcFv8_015500 [Champsocephalus esox]
MPGDSGRICARPFGPGAGAEHHMRESSLRANVISKQGEVNAGQKALEALGEVHIQSTVMRGSDTTRSANGCTPHIPYGRSLITSTPGGRGHTVRPVHQNLALFLLFSQTGGDVICERHNRPPPAAFKALLFIRALCYR